MTRARDVSRLITTPPSIYQTDTESSSAGYLSQSSASSTYQTIAGNNNSYRNKIINGDFNIWQRGTSFTEATLSQSATASYCADRWYGFRPPDGAGYSISRQLSGLTGFKYCARVQRPNTNGKSDRCVFAQSIETANFIPIAGQTVTLSFYARIGANFSATSNSLNVNIITGTGEDQSAYDISTFPSNGNYSSAATVLNQTFNLTTSWIRYTATFSTASTATESTIRFSFQPTGVAGANDWFEITGVQLELGSVATPYESISIADELAQCQRYYHKSFPPTVTPASSYTSTRLELMGARHQVADVVGFRSQTLFFPVEMRVNPTLTFYNGSTNSTVTLRLYSNNNQTQDLSGYGAYAPDVRSFYVSFYTGVTVGTSGLSCMIFFNYTASSEI